MTAQQERRKQGWALRRGARYAAELVGELDADRDGALSEAEFAAGVARWFENWDRDENGRLSRRELDGPVRRR